MIPDEVARLRFPRPTRDADVSDEVRTLIFHYHLFKNAGTSVDEMLKRNFGVQWVNREFRISRQANKLAVAEFVRRECLRVRAISSHTALLPAPRIQGLEIFPIIFVRHPIDRLRSAYEFERLQVANTPGSQLAKRLDFAGYVRELLRRNHRQVNNFQTFRLALNEQPSEGEGRLNALRTLQALPFVGLVEAYEKSLYTLERLLRRPFPAFRATNTHLNAGQSRVASLQERLALIERQLGHELYEEVCGANQDDLAVFGFLEARYACL
jgi:hypothetical protein